MSGVTQKIRRFTGGISDQPDEQKLPGQVRDALNCTPDVVYGLLKRPGTNLIPWKKKNGFTLIMPSVLVCGSRALASRCRRSSPS